MSADAEVEIDKFIANLNKILSKVDTELVLKTMYYERKMRDVYPSVELEIHYKSDANMERKRDEIRSRYGFMVALHGTNEVLAKGNMSVGMIQEISKDPDVEEITGSVSIASY